MGKLVVMIVFVGLLAGAYLFGSQMSNPNPQSSYVPANGDCFVPPQGQDPVYDQFYANEVNPANCEAYLDQSEAHINDSVSRKIDSDTTKGNVSFWLFIGLIGGIVAFFAWAARK